MHRCKGLLGGGVLGNGVLEIFRWEALDVSTRPQAHNTSSSRSCLEWAAQRKNTCSCPTSSFQRKLFLLLEVTDLGEVFVETWETAKCMLDDFRAADIRQVQGWRASTTQSRRSCINKWRNLSKMDVADIESRHASLRRMLKSLAQTHMLNKANMSAQVVGRSLAKRQQRAGGRGAVSAVAAATSTVIFQVKSTRGFKREVRWSHLPEERKGTTRHP